MGLKKYEIITVGSDKRVRALRSWQVGDRYVNIGDVGGIVYDEKTLSQDGLCWLFRGNFGFPGARIGGDSIVDVAEATLSATGAPAVDILGSSVVVGSKLRFTSEPTAADAVVLTADDFEQGNFNYAAGVNWETCKAASNNFLRTKSPIFSGGAPVTVKCAVEGYAVSWYTTDADGIMTGAAMTQTVTGAGVSITIPAGQYFIIRLRKDPMATIVPADAAAARITFTGTYETKLSIIDSRVAVNPANSTGIATIKPGGLYSIKPGAAYPDSVIRNSKVVINGHATANRVVRLISEFIGCNVAIDATSGDSQGAGVYSNVKNLTFTGVVTTNWNVAARSIIQAHDCDNFVVSPTVFPGLVTVQLTNMPFIFRGCNVPNGRFYHHAQIANTYKNIDFAKASANLGNSIAGTVVLLVSSEVDGLYRLYAPGVQSAFGALVESYDSVKSLNLAGAATTYGTTIYKDAYLNGLFDIAGTNVFGHKVHSHPLAQVLNVQPRAVQGVFNTVTVGETITGVVANVNHVCVPVPFRVNSDKGLSVNNVPTGVGVIMLFTTTGNVITNSVTAPSVPSNRLTELQAYLVFRKSVGGPITPEDLAGVTVTVYNGCKIVNTGATAINMKGNIRVEDNATIVNAAVVGTGYFGGNSVLYYNPAVWAALECTGSAFMKDNAVFAPTAITGACAVVHMEGNAKFIGSSTVPITSLSFIMGNNAVIEGKANTRSGVVMSGNSKVTATGQIMSDSRGALVMKDNASIEANTTVIGAITLAGNYKGNVVKTWIGKRTITDVNEPEYDNNVKTQYEHEHDF